MTDRYDRALVIVWLNGRDEGRKFGGIWGQVRRGLGFHLKRKPMKLPSDPSPSPQCCCNGKKWEKLNAATGKMDVGTRTESGS